jgi:hypothetical protein
MTAAGADILFIDALESEDEMRRFCWAGGAAARAPKVRLAHAGLAIAVSSTDAAVPADGQHARRRREDTNPEPCTGGNCT